MQRTRVKALRHGRPLGREPLIASVRRQEAQNQSNPGKTPTVDAESAMLPRCQ
jgi:hypothetical protein